MIYLDSAATTYPKPRNVYNATMKAMTDYSFNSGRGGYQESINASTKIYEVRQKCAEFFGFKAENIAFTNNCTASLNMAIKGVVKRGDHVITSSLEHNAVARPLNRLYEDGIITYLKVDYNKDKEILLKSFQNGIKQNTRVAVIMHASNVFGVSFPITEIGKICKDNGIILIVDAAQSAGLLSIDANRDNIDILCMAGHKGLYGMMGVGILAVRDTVKLSTIIEGGTGSLSFNLNQPDFMPDRIEAGTLNNSGIISVGAGIDFINIRGREKILAHELGLIDYLYDKLEKNNDAVLYVQKNEIKTPVLSFNYKDYSSEKTASLLGENNIALRAGFHCAPFAHESFNTADRGTVRICPSAFSTKRECETFIKILKNI